jgi:hypothetical protein
MNAAEMRAAFQGMHAEKRDITIEPVPTPEWPELDGHVHVKVLSVGEREIYLKSLREIESGNGNNSGDKDNDKVVNITVTVHYENANAKLAAATMCDKDGVLVFTAEDVALLTERHYACMERIRDVAARLNGLDARARITAKNVLPSAVTSALSTASH